MFDLFKSHGRAALREHPFPDAWRTIIAANAPYIAALPDADRAEIEGHVQIFLAAKKRR